MGLFGKIRDVMTGTKRPDHDTPILSSEEVKKKILAVNRDTAPFQIKEGGEEKADLVAEWKIVDAKWYEIFAKAGKKDTFKILLTLNPETHEVLALDKRFTVEWSAGIPKLSIDATYFRGQQQAKSFGTAYAFTEELRPGQVYNYRFDTGELKKPLQTAILSCGWSYKGVVK